MKQSQREVFLYLLPDGYFVEYVNDTSAKKRTMSILNCHFSPDEFKKAKKYARSVAKYSKCKLTFVSELA